MNLARPVHHAPLAWTIAALGAAACTGSIADQGPGAASGGISDHGGTRPPGEAEPGIVRPPSDVGGGGTSVVPPPPPPPPAGVSAGALPFLRLTREQYANSVRDLLGVPNAGSMLPPNGKNEVGFAAGGAVSSVEVDAWSDAAATIALAVESKWAQLVPCEVAKAGEAPCAAQFVRTFGRRVFRRPLMAEEERDLNALYGKGRGELGLDHAGGIGLVLEAMLQSPSFLYRWELGPRAPGQPNTDGLIRLGDHELASRLSYFLWNSTPDATLSVAADAGKLTSATDLAAQARRLLTDEVKTKQALEAFTLSWLHLSDLDGASKNPARFPGFNDAIKSAMPRETTEFVSAVLLEGDGKLETLLLAPYTYINGALAPLYGLSGVTGEAFRKVNTTAGQRAGVLTHAGLLARGAGPAFASPTRRGEIIRDRLLCDVIPPPPPTVDTTLPPPESEAPSSIRQQYEAHARNPSCAACHAQIDPLGFAFLRYDAIGRWDGAPGIDTSGTLTASGEASDGAFADGLGLARRLASSAKVRACMTRQIFRFAVGRKETDADAPSLMEAQRRFEVAGQDVRELLVAVVTSPAFLFRASDPGEAMP